jgi:hypothetical protein
VAGATDSFKATSDGGSASVTLKKASQQVVLSAAAGNTGVIATDGDHDYQIGSIKNVRGFVASSGGRPLAGLGGVGSDKFRVAIFDEGQPVFTGGYEASGGKLGVFLSDPGGNQTAKIETDAGSGKLSLLGPGGKEVATLGATQGGGDGGELTLSKASDTIKLGYGGASGASLVFDDGGEEAFSVKKDSDGGKLVLGKGDRSIVLKTSGGEAIAIAKSGARVTEMGVTQKSTGFVIGEAAKPLAALVDNGDNKPFMRIYDNGGGKAILSAGYESNGKAAFRLGDPSKPLALLQESAKSAGELNLYGPGGGELAVNLGVGDSGAAGLRLSSGGHEGAVLAAKPGGGGAMRIYDGGNTAASVETDGGNAAISVFAGGKERASLVNRGGTGAVVLWSASGNPLVRLVNSGNGGSMVISDSGGGDVLEARADPSVGGLVCVNYKNVQKCLGQGLTGMEGFH